MSDYIDVQKTLMVSAFLINANASHAVICTEQFQQLVCVPSRSLHINCGSAVVRSGLDLAGLYWVLLAPITRRYFHRLAVL